MKKKTIRNQLFFMKRTVADLDMQQMAAVRGGNNASGCTTETLETEGGICYSDQLGCNPEHSVSTCSGVLE